MRELSGDEGGDFGGEPLGLDPGEHEEACVVDDELQIAPSLSLIPPDEALARGKLPGASPEADQGYAQITREDLVAHLAAGQRGVAEVVVSADVLVHSRAAAGALTGCTIRQGSS